MTLRCVSIPHHSRQVGSLFFKTPRKIKIFGTCMKGSGSQHNFLDCYFYKFIKVNAFYLHVYAILINVFCSEYRSKQKQICHLIFAMGVMIGLHRAIGLHMQIPGHTLCQVDISAMLRTTMKNYISFFFNGL